MRRLYYLLLAALALLAFSCQDSLPPVVDDPVTIPDPKPEPKPEPELEVNSYILDSSKTALGSVELSNLGEYICIAATPVEGVESFDAVFGQDEYFYVAISPLLNGREFDLMTEQNLYTVMSTLDGAYLESVAPSMKEEIKAGKCLFDYKEGKAEVIVTLTLNDGRSLAVRMEADEPGIVVNENIFAIAGDEKPLRTAFYLKENGLTTLYLTPAGIEFFEDIAITTYYAYIILEDSQCNGWTLNVNEIAAVGYGDNFNEIYVDSRETEAEGTLRVASDPDNDAHYQVYADVKVGGTTVTLRFDGDAIDANAKEVVKNEVIYAGKPYVITSVYVEEAASPESTCSVLIHTERNDVVRISLPADFLDGKAHGFSQSPDLYIEYDGQVYSKAAGYSGTVTVGLEGDIIRIDATNYDNLKITYEGAVGI